MKIDPEGREYVYFPVESTPAEAAVHLKFGHVTTWFPTERVDTDTIRILIQGPEYPADGFPAAVLPLGKHRIRSKLVAAPEVIFRDVPTFPDGYVEIGCE